jgi:hypothetical protein
MRVTPGWLFPQLLPQGEIRANSRRKCRLFSAFSPEEHVVGHACAGEVGQKSGQIDFSRAINTRGILQTHNEISLAKLLYRKFSTFTRFQSARSVRVQPRHPNRQSK